MGPGWRPSVGRTICSTGDSRKAAGVQFGESGEKMNQSEQTKKTPKLLRKIVIGVTVFFVIAVTFLETGSRYYKCPSTGCDCSDILVCDPNHYPVNQEKVQTIQGLIELKRQGIEPSRKDLDQIINLVEFEEIYGLNGVLCGSDMVFVRDNLSAEGKYYVVRHELEHLFLRNGINIECSDKEQCAMLNAAKVYPVGFVETILSSVYLSAKESPTVWCFLFGSWRIFRTHILTW